MYCDKTGKSRINVQQKPNKTCSKPVIKCTANFEVSPWKHTTITENHNKTLRQPAQIVNITATKKERNHKP